MKIDVQINHSSGDVRCYPVHKLVKREDGWTVHYTIVKNGRHEGRKAVVGNNAVLICEDLNINGMEIAFNFPMPKTINQQEKNENEKDSI